MEPGTSLVERHKIVAARGEAYGAFLNAAVSSIRAL